MNRARPPFIPNMNFPSPYYNSRNIHSPAPHTFTYIARLRTRRLSHVSIHLCYNTALAHHTTSRPTLIIHAKTMPRMPTTMPTTITNHKHSANYNKQMVHRHSRLRSTGATHRSQEQQSESEEGDETENAHEDTRRADENEENAEDDLASMHFGREG